MLRLGIIGMSPGNGHPYSWSAICNGYDKSLMEDCGFSVIPRYLEKHKYPDDFIHEAQVTHVWTQDQKLSQHIARASKIACCLQIIKILLAPLMLFCLRNDAENHSRFAKRFFSRYPNLYR